jgi:hypothetical protein
VSVDKIHEWVCCGFITAEEGAALLEMRRLIEWKRKPWWKRLALRVIGVGP